jgi:ATP-binding cassette subfamily B protein
MLSNLVYVTKDLLASNKLALAAMIAYILASLAAPLLGTLTSYYVVLALTSQASPTQYLSMIGILSAALLVVSSLRIWGMNYYKWNCTFARCIRSWNRLSYKAITTDYLNVEPKESRALFNRAWEAISGNYVGIEMMMDQVPEIIIGFLGMLGYAIYASIYLPWIALVMAGMAVISVFWGIWSYRYSKKVQKEDEKNWNMSYVLNDDITKLENAKDIRAYRLDRWFDKVYQTLAASLFSLTLKIRLHVFVGDVSDCLLLFIRDALAYSLLLPTVLSGQMGLAEFTFLIGIIAGFSVWVNQAVGAYKSAKLESIRVSDYRKACQLPETFNHGKGKDIAALKKPFTITFDHVSFTYPGSQKEILHGINLTITPGEKIALVGNNGAGKTTLVKLLCGLYQPTSGRILLDGIDIREFSIEDYFSLLSPLFQDSQPLAFTVQSNVAACPDDLVDKEKMNRALELAGLKDKVASLPQKENTFISQTFNLSGVQLSGGETQKLLLARALYKNAPLLILDEPTAALDPLSEESMYRQYLSFANGNTSIFISHRLASTRFCDRIIYLEDGKIEEEGTHEELLKAHKKYREMFEIQAKYYKEGEKENETHEIGL